MAENLKVAPATSLREQAYGRCTKHLLAISLAHRDIALGYHLPTDEFTDNGNFPWQLCIREGRRLRGLYTLSEHDVAETGQRAFSRRHRDAIVGGSFPDRQRSGAQAATRRHDHAGGVSRDARRDHPSVPDPLSHHDPEKIDGLIVLVAASASHVALLHRLDGADLDGEPGQAAGTAAHLALGLESRDVPPEDLQPALRPSGQVIDTAPVQEGSSA